MFYVGTTVGSRGVSQVSFDTTADTGNTANPQNKNPRTKDR